MVEKWIYEKRKIRAVLVSTKGEERERVVVFTPKK